MDRVFNIQMRREHVAIATHFATSHCVGLARH